MSSPVNRPIADPETARASRSRLFPDVLLPPLVAIVIVVSFQSSTNFIDVSKFTWDNVRYLAMAQTWFSIETMTSPFAYRWGTPALARALSDAFSVSLTFGFQLVAWVGAVAQLVAVFWLVRAVFSSSKAGWAGLVVTALSVWNVRFLLFDPFRPDHLAYPIVILASLAALKRQWWWLLGLTLLGFPFREFTVIPLLAALATLVTTREFGSRLASSTMGSSQRRCRPLPTSASASRQPSSAAMRALTATSGVRWSIPCGVNMLSAT